MAQQGSASQHARIYITPFTQEKVQFEPFSTFSKPLFVLPLRLKQSAHFVEYLLKNGADPNKCELTPSNLCWAASYIASPEITILLCNYGASLNQRRALLYSASNGNLEIEKCLLENGLTPENDGDVYQSQPTMHGAVQKNRPEVVELLRDMEHNQGRRIVMETLLSILLGTRTRL